jgi:hypothetical protein
MQNIKHSVLCLSDWQFFYYRTAKYRTKLKIQETLDNRKSDNGLNLPHCWITAHHLSELIISIKPTFEFHLCWNFLFRWSSYKERFFARDVVVLLKFIMAKFRGNFPGDWAKHFPCKWGKGNGGGILDGRTVESWHGIITSFFQESWRGKVVWNFKLEGIGTSNSSFQYHRYFLQSIPSSGRDGGVEGELERRHRGASSQEGSKIPTWLTASPVYKLN